MLGSIPPQPPQRRNTLSSLVRSVTNKKEKEPETKLKEVFITKYELDWDKLKDWLDKRFAGYNCTFTKNFNVSGDKYRVYLPEELTKEERMEIALLDA